MNSAKPISALQYAILGILLLAIVVLLALCFNIAGTFACSILTGIILGANRQWKWYLVPVSLVFPAVTLGLLEFSRNDLPPGKRILVAAVCWGGFAGTYLMAYLLVCLERRGGNMPVATDNHPAGSGGASSAVNAGAQAVSAALPGKLTTELLQGKWSCEGDTLHAPAEKKTLQVAGDELTLYVMDVKGVVTSQAKAHFRLA